MPEHGAYDVFYVKIGPIRPIDVKNGKNVKGQGECYHYFIVNGVKGCKWLCN